MYVVGLLGLNVHYIHTHLRRGILLVFCNVIVIVLVCLTLLPLQPKVFFIGKVIKKLNRPTLWLWRFKILMCAILKYTVHLIEIRFQENLLSNYLHLQLLLAPFFLFFLIRHELFDSISFLHYGLLFCKRCMCHRTFHSMQK